MALEENLLLLLFQTVVSSNSILKIHPCVPTGKFISRLSSKKFLSEADRGIPRFTTGQNVEIS